jgi:acyl carrier protein
MHQDDIKMAFVEILEGVAAANRADITADHRLREDLGIDSLSLIDVAVAVEDMLASQLTAPSACTDLGPD